MSIVGRGLCLIEKDQINCPKFSHVEIKIVSDSDSDKTVKVWVQAAYSFESAMEFLMGFRIILENFVFNPFIRINQEYKPDE